MRLYYAVVTQLVRWLLLPLLILYAAHAFVRGGGSVDVLVELGYDIGVLLLVFGLFLVIGGRTANRAICSASARVRHADEPELIQSRLETGQPPPLAGALAAEVGVFVSGHTHAPSLTHSRRPTGRQGASVNSGCWLRQLQPVPARLSVPPVFVSRFVQTHVRVYRDNQTTQVELCEHPRPVTQRLRAAERLAVAGRLPTEPDAHASPRVRARTSIEGPRR